MRLERGRDVQRFIFATFVYCPVNLMLLDALFFMAFSKGMASGWNLGFVRDSSEEQRLDKALHAVELMEERGIPISRDAIYRLLQGCNRRKDLEAVRRIRSLMMRNGFDSITVLSDQLIRLFALCGSLHEASQVFRKVSNPTVYTWNAIMSAHTKLGEGQKALDCYRRMKMQGINPDTVTFLWVLKACSSVGALGQGRLIHDQISICGLESSLTMGNTLIDMYAKCGSLEEARKVFDELQNRNVVSWGAMLTGYTACGHAVTTLELFEKMKEEGIKPSRVTFLCALKACGYIKALGKGRCIHDEIITNGLEIDDIIGSSLIDTYAKLDNLEDAQKLFHDLLKQDAVSWGAMISGYAQHGQGELALELFKQMQQGGIRPGEFIFSSILKACASIISVGQGMLTHDQIMQSGLDLDVVIGSALVDMYAKCEKLENACKVFENIGNRDLVSWGAMIDGYAQHGHGQLAIVLFKKMQLEGITPGKAIFLSTLKACGNTGAIDEGRLIHHQISRTKLHFDSAVGNALIDMYAKCGSLKEAHDVFSEMPERTVVSWGAMISGYVMQGHGFQVLELFVKMSQEGILANEIIYLSMIKACGIIRNIEQGRLVHNQIIRSGLLLDVMVGSTLVDMYIKCGSLEDAHIVFDELPCQDSVSCGTMMAGFVAHGHGLPVLDLLEEVQEKGLKPDKVMFSCSLKASSILGAVEWGKWIHEEMIKAGFDLNVVLRSNLVDMYVKCGSLWEAKMVFDGLSNQDVVSWGALISGYALYGDLHLIQRSLEDMQQQGLKPVDVIFTSILSACTQAGLLEEACRYFRSMTEGHCILPSIEHYSCMVDLLGRAGKLEDAGDLLRTMAIPPDVVVWRSLLTSCRTYCNVELGRQCFSQVVQLDPCDASGYVLLSSMQADVGMWEDFEMIEQMKNFAGVLKQPGMAWIDIDKKVHEFVVGSQSHTQSVGIYGKLKSLTRFINWDGHVPQLDMAHTMLDLYNDTPHLVTNKAS